MTLKSCLKSMRLRTLPLSLAGINMGILIAASVCRPDIRAVVFLVLTTCLLQILSNLSNELGDCLAGTDTADRQGMHYSIMDGEMTIPEMKRLIIVVATLCCICGLLMIFFSFGKLLALEPVIFILLGAGAIAAALRYTLGKNPYGYRGLGDIFVFIFFGLVSTIGAFYICSHDFHDLSRALLPACAMGCFSVGVLNVNNIRDMKTDEATRTTVAIKLGERNARIYQTLLIATGWLLLVINAAIFSSSWWFLLAMPLFILHLKGVWTRNGKALDPMLPLLVLSTFILSLLAGAGLLQ